VRSFRDPDLRISGKVRASIRIEKPRKQRRR
jgi:hypothetical protein